MASKARTEGQERRRTFTEEARRAQLIECAVEVLATRGYGQATLAEIAKRAGIVRSAVLYHFSGRDELMQEVVRTLYERGAVFMRERIEAVDRKPPDQLRAYLESNLAFLGDHARHVAATVEVARNHRREDGSLQFGLETMEATIQPLEELLAWGQGTGDFRPFSTRLLALAIRAAIDAVAGQLIAHPDLDVDAAGRELSTAFLRAVAASPASIEEAST
jgi:TetR/AcrR family transcriptional regulator, fatty acid metabolism regulator protein